MQCMACNIAQLHDAVVPQPRFSGLLKHKALISGMWQFLIGDRHVCSCWIAEQLLVEMAKHGVLCRVAAELMMLSRCREGDAGKLSL